MRINLWLLMAFCSIIGFVSCSEDDIDDGGEIIESNSIVDIALGDDQFSILVEALTKADLVTTLEGAGPFTVFAPTNDAFTDLLTELGLSSLDDVDVATLEQILLNHVVAGDNRSTDLSSGFVKTSSDAGPDETNLDMYIDTSNGVTLNGRASVTSADVVADNGVIHVIDKVITLPTVVDFAVAKTDFSELVAAVTKAELAGTLSSEGPFTVFAPTNDAFNDLYNELGVSGVSGIANSILEPVLLYHVLSGNNLSSILSDDLTLSSLNSVTPEITVNIGDDGTVTLTDYNGGVAEVVMVDVQAVNGVIHVIDKVILPAL